MDNIYKRKVSRRNFLKTSSLIGGGLTINFLKGEKVRANEDQPLLSPQGTWVYTCCHMCGGGTGIKVQVVDGVAYKIEPNAYNPLGVCNISQDYEKEASKGSAVCPKGNAGLMSLYDPDRVKKPLLRTNKQKGKGVDPKWQEISWEKAFELITQRLKKLQDQSTPERLITFSESTIAKDIQQDFGNLFGTPNVSFHTNLCSASRKAAALSITGEAEPLGDYANTNYMLIFGWNPLGATKWSHLPKIITKGIKNGAKLVVIDPWCNETASKAHQWIAIKPGADGALALAIGHILIREGLYNKEFVDNWTAGFNEYAQYVKDKTPEWAALITGVPIETINQLARELADAHAAIVDTWAGPGHHSNAVDNMRAIFMLNLLLGTIDKPGGLLLPRKSILNKGPLKLKKISKSRFDGLDNYPLGHSSGVYVETMEKLREGNGPYPLEVGIATMTNLVFSVPGTEQVIEAIKKLDFFVVIDNYLSETALLADIVLPGTTYLERYGLVSRGITWPMVALRQPVVEPTFGQYPEYDIFIQLGRRLRLKDAEEMEPFANLTYEEYLDFNLYYSLGFGLEQLKKMPGAVWQDPKGTVFQKYKEGLNTPTARFQFTLNSYNGKKIYDIYGQDAGGLPVYREKKWQPDEEYPLYLISWKQANHTHSRTFNNPYLMDIKNYNPLYMNITTAQDLGINDGDSVWVESPYSKDKAIVKVIDGIHPQVVGWQWGYGHWGFGKVAQGKGTNASQFNFLQAEPISGQALHKEVCVRVYKASI
ncbi:MAG: hypothetical protein VR72_11550 [Clostridiaceae bacterium BRH_c20a]|nr:MAG: hypothetical protein VR72_11550 [Clostridiaceae bacterium BRH_c20a]